MYFVKYQPLKRKLKERTLTDREAVVYLLVYSVLLMMSAGIPLETLETMDECNDCGLMAWDYVAIALVNAAIAFAGIYYIYVANGGNSGFDLIQKYFVLGWVVGIRCLIVFLPFWVATLVVSAEVFGNEWEDRTQYRINYFLIFLAYVVYFQRLGRHIRDTRNTAIESVR
ncbi:MAG: hypothetical protein F4Z21_05090 [Acidobacteria bacterium]|nr:hypothetical protein [Acidobacteriota bacterium]